MAAVNRLENNPLSKIVVVGGGIIGLTSAVRIIEELQNVQVTVISKDFSPDTTGDVSAGFWRPYLPGDVPVDQMKKWLDESFEFFLNLCMTAEAGDIGVGLLSTFDESILEDETNCGSDQMLGYRDMTKTELRAMFGDAQKGIFYTTIYAQCELFLPYLKRRLESQGGHCIQEEVESLQDLIGRYDAIINCTGIASSKLASDPLVYPIRGQVIRVEAPWLKHAVNSNSYYILPNSTFTILGGTTQKGDWNLESDPEDTQRIFDGTCSLVRSLKKAKIIDVKVGLRPARTGGPRVEKDSSLPVICTIINFVCHQVCGL